MAEQHYPSSITEDEEVQSTNDDAASCKLSLVKLGYWEDPYLQYFTKPCPRKPPEMNRGYYTRVRCIESLISQFIRATDKNCQFVNLGAGFDTSFWKFYDKDQMPVKWIDVDFEPVVRRKLRTVLNRPELLKAIKLTSSGDNICNTTTELHSTVYHLISCDLRRKDQLESKLLNDCALDSAKPTIFLAECVLVYMPKNCSTDLIRWIGDQFKRSFFVNYEQVNMKDRFAEVMIENLHSRGCSLMGADHCKDLQSQYSRFIDNGWDSVNGGTILDLYSELPKKEIERIEKIEFLDDREMLNQLFSHYCIVWAVKGQCPPLLLNNTDLSNIMV